MSFTELKEFYKARMSTLSVPDSGKSGKKARPKSPRRKAPSAPKKKKASHDKDDPSHGKSHKSDGNLSVPGGGRKATPSGKGEEKSLRRSISPRKEQYMSLLDEMVGQGDMVLLDPITEDSILQNLNKRFVAGEIYVSTTGLGWAGGRGHISGSKNSTSYYQSLRRIIS